jgi:hypothetical protein
MKKILFTLLLAIFLWFGSCCIATAQGAPLVPLVLISLPTEQLVHLHSDDGQFSPVVASPGETVDIYLHFPAVYAGMPLLIEATDGGDVQLSDLSMSINFQGRASFQFQAAAGPGLYRILILAGDTPSMLRFQVPNPGQ